MGIDYCQRLVDRTVCGVGICRCVAWQAEGQQLRLARGPGRNGKGEKGLIPSLKIK